MFGKLAEAKKKADEIKQRLANITVEGESGAGKVKVMASADRKIKQVVIADELLHAERREELQELVELAVNDALEKANQISESEMRSMMSGMLPGLGNLFGGN